MLAFSSKLVYFNSFNIGMSKIRFDHFVKPHRELSVLAGGSLNSRFSQDFCVLKSLPKGGTCTVQGC